LFSQRKNAIHYSHLLCVVLLFILRSHDLAAGTFCCFQKI
jgi:hypothetical protein